MLFHPKKVDHMNRRMPLLVVFAIAFVYSLAGSCAKAQAQSFTGKWVHQGVKGTSILEFLPGEKRVLGPTKGAFHHSLVLDDGRVIQGDGHYVFRSIGPNRGWLTLHFADGNVTHEHEHTNTDNSLSVRHHGVTRTYVRQPVPAPTSK
jgi:hypothetical protein